MKTIAYTLTAMTALKRHANKARLIRAKIEQFAANPEAQARNVKALVGSDRLRLRVQDFRILFTETADTITIHDIGRAAGSTTKDKPTCP
ncbi:type II toxin-antitoxin system RelE family toxin [Bradyrhizobium oligotrophicum]|uniref:type II toxin-antitoxin system RelE family toxin n=1 Tax=Bradyrhizobium oligotrophicum TaxID=44255 RepID=UPI003EBFD13D